MPLCYIHTNLKDSDISDDFEDKLQSCISEILNKPLERIYVVLNCGVRMNFAGKKQPGLVCQIHSIGVFDEQRNPEYFPKFFEVLTSCTKLPASSVAIELVDLKGHMAKTGSAV